MIVKVTHLTSAHPRYDTRIFLKMCTSLAKSPYRIVNLVVADGRGGEVVKGVNIFDVGRKKSRLLRMTHTVARVYMKALELNSDIYHVHDPELLPAGLKLKKQGKVVIFDMHENTPKQIRDKHYLPRILRLPVAVLYSIYEKHALRRLDCVVLAEASYCDDYSECCENIEVILNMPDLSLLQNFYVSNRRGQSVFYLGNISVDRGLDVTVNAFEKLASELPNINMHFVGPFQSDERWVVRGMTCKNIQFHGPMPLLEGLAISEDAFVGISILKPLENYKKSYSTKIFEYMAIGLPVITSNFDLYRDIVEKYNCGICVDPGNHSELIDAVTYIFNNPEEAHNMGSNGKKLVEEQYNWAREEAKLIGLYDGFAMASTMRARKVV